MLARRRRTRCNHTMATMAGTLPEVPCTLKAMLLAEWHAARLEQIINEFQRQHFGHRAETLLKEQLLLVLEGLEQFEVTSDAATVATHAAERLNWAARAEDRCVGSTAVEILVNIDDHAYRRGHHALPRIGEDVSGRLDTGPSSLRLSRRHRRRAARLPFRQHYQDRQ